MIKENKSNLIIIKENDNYILYSYTSLIAKFDTKNNNLYLTKYYNYSKTTSKHLNYFIKNYCPNKDLKDKKNIDLQEFIYII